MADKKPESQADDKYYWDWTTTDAGATTICQQCQFSISVLYSVHPAERPIQLDAFLCLIDSHERDCWGGVFVLWDVLGNLQPAATNSYKQLLTGYLPTYPVFLF